MHARDLSQTRQDEGRSAQNFVDLVIRGSHGVPDPCSFAVMRGPYLVYLQQGFGDTQSFVLCQFDSAPSSGV
jgi:hypothetical protein